MGDVRQHRSRIPRACQHDVMQFQSAPTQAVAFGGDALAAHVIGASMGGMIAQTLAARHPRAVRSLVSIMSNTGSRRSGQPSLRVYPIFLRRPPRGREELIAHMERLFAVIGSPGLPRDAEDLHAIATASYERDHEPEGSGRQLAAIIASGDRTAELRAHHRADLVVHGTADPLVAPSGGRATARAIPGAELMTIEGMGHDLPRAIWPELIDAIAARAVRRRPHQRASVPTGPPRRGPVGRRDSQPARCPPASPSASLRPAAAGTQAKHRVRAPARAPAALRLHPHQPVQVVATVRTPVRPATVHRADHPVLVATNSLISIRALRPLSGLASCLTESPSSKSLPSWPGVFPDQHI